VLKERKLTEQELVALGRRALDDSVEHLDAATLSFLNRARHQALEQANAAPRWQWLPLAGRGIAGWGGIASLGAASCALVLAVMIALPGGSLTDGPADDLSMPMLAEDASMAALEDQALLEDLDMMLWLIEAENHAS
jgi:hypothetical protein